MNGNQRFQPGKNWDGPESQAEHAAAETPEIAARAVDQTPVAASESLLQKVGALPVWVPLAATAVLAGLAGGLVGAGLADGSGEIHALEATVATLEGEKQQAREVAAELDNELSRAQEEISGLEEAVQQVDKRQAELDDLQAELEQQKKGLQETEDALAEREAAVGKAEDKAAANSFGNGTHTVGSDIAPEGIAATAVNSVIGPASPDLGAVWVRSFVNYGDAEDVAASCFIDRLPVVVMDV